MPGQANYSASTDNSFLPSFSSARRRGWSRRQSTWEKAARRRRPGGGSGLPRRYKAGRRERALIWPTSVAEGRP